MLGDVQPPGDLAARLDQEGIRITLPVELLRLPSAVLVAVIALPDGLPADKPTCITTETQSVRLFSLPWSNGQAERQIMKLKMIKRQMSGERTSTCSSAMFCLPPDPYKMRQSDQTGVTPDIVVLIRPTFCHASHPVAQFCPEELGLSFRVFGPFPKRL